MDFDVIKVNCFCISCFYDKKKKRGAEGPNIGHFQNRRRKVGYMISFALRRRLKSCILKKICNDTLIFVCPLSCDI